MIKRKYKRSQENGDQPENSIVKEEENIKACSLGKCDPLQTISNN